MEGTRGWSGATWRGCSSGQIWYSRCQEYGCPRLIFAGHLAISEATTWWHEAGITNGQTAVLRPWSVFMRMRAWLLPAPLCFRACL